MILASMEEWMERIQASRLCSREEVKNLQIFTDQNLLK